MSKIPTASSVAASVPKDEPIAMDALLEHLKTLSPADLIKVQKAVTAQLEKALKNASKPVKAVKAVKKANPNAGQQLVKPRAWVNYVLAYAHQNGWEAFTIRQNKKDKATGEKTEVITEMAESVCVDGVYYFADTIDSDTGKGKTMIPKHAMSLSKIYKAERPELYAEFEAQYVPPQKPVSDVETDVETDVESEAESKVQPEPEKKESEKKPKKKVEKKKKESKKESVKESKKESVKKSEKPAKKKKEKSESKEDDSPVSIPDDLVPALPVKKPKNAKNTKKSKKDTWTCEDDGDFHEWTHEGQKYQRDYKNRVFRQNDEGITADDWMGIWNPTELCFEEAPLPEEFASDDN